MKTLGIIFSNIYDDTMGQLTAHRSVASLPFGGRYRQIDFVLSNMSNAGICNVGIVTNHNYRSLMDHLGSGDEWDLNRKNEGLHFLPPFATGSSGGMYSGKLQALYSSLWFINNPEYDYVFLSDANVICNIDLKKALEQHKAGGADVTVIANEENDGRVRSFVLREDNGKVKDMLTNAPAPEGWLCSLGMFIFSREYLVRETKMADSRNLWHLERDLIQNNFNEGSINIGVYRYNGTVLRNEDIPAYFKNNMRMLDTKVSSDIFKAKRQIYTRVHDQIPSYYAEGSKVGNSIIADGCTIKGKVENSVLFRNVEVGSGARVRNCIIMQDAKIADNANLEYVIFDKNCIINEGTVLKGSPEHCLIIGKDETV